MRKLILQEFITIDGFAADTEGGMDAMFGNGEEDGEPHMDFLRPEDDIDTILYGAVTYGGMADYWPTATEAIADKVNAAHIIVFSKSLNHAPWGKQAEATIIRENATEAVLKLKQQPGKNMIIYGSIKMAQSLMKDGVIDEYQLRVCPVILGKGKRLFSDNTDTLNMELLETKVYKSGLILLRYQPDIKKAE
ncbi:MAG: dihydrofolate reductase family protein [Fibrella sp.]|nr:dihydrofolate reductase family protein [Armatimonadota bacterium]